MWTCKTDKPFPLQVAFGHGNHSTRNPNEDTGEEVNFTSVSFFSRPGPAEDLPTTEFLHPPGIIQPGIQAIELECWAVRMRRAWLLGPLDCRKA